MSQKYGAFENQKQEDIPVGIPVNVNTGPETSYDPVVASSIKFRNPNSENKLTNQPSVNYYGSANYQPHFANNQQYHHQPHVVNNQQHYHQPQFAQRMPPNANQVRQRFPTYQKPEALKCPCCKMDIITVMNYESGNTAYIWGGIICCVSLCCCPPLCCCAPFYGNCCMDKNHYCPACGFNIIRKHRPLFDC